MNRTTIEWVLNPDGSQGYTWNPITGCLNHDNGLCKGGRFPCYACKLAKGRLKPLYLANKNWDTRTPEGYDGYPNLDPFYPRFWEERLKQPYKRLESSGIFVCDMGELYAPWVPKEWGHRVFEVIADNPWHRFYTLTKQSQELIKFSPFPDNCCVGVTATNSAMFSIASNYMAQIDAKVKFYSLEPLLSWDFKADWDKDNQCLYRRLIAVDWLIIGACTGTLKEMVELGLMNEFPDKQVLKWGNKYTLQPRIEWLREIVEAADQAGIPVFLKNNLDPLIISSGFPEFVFDKSRGHPFLRQELPE